CQAGARKSVPFESPVPVSYGCLSFWISLESKAVIRCLARENSPRVMHDLAKADAQLGGPLRARHLFQDVPVEDLKVLRLDLGLDVLNSYLDQVPLPLFIPIWRHAGGGIREAR